jgi:hypothetical protein
VSFFVFGRQILLKNPFQIVVAWSGIDIAVSAQLLFDFFLPNFVWLLPLQLYIAKDDRGAR